VTERSRFVLGRSERALIPILLGGAFLRLLWLGRPALIGDESYYWLWSTHLDWAYFDHPAGVALLTWLSTAVGGSSEAGIRWLNAAAGVASIGLTYMLGARLLSRPAGLFAALALALGAPYLLISRLVYTDGLQLLLMLLNLYWFWRLVTERPASWITVAGFGLSLAALLNTKYSAYLYAVALCLVVLIDHRGRLADRRVWLGVLIAAMGLLPVLVWNAAHGWTSVRWQVSHFGFNLAGTYSLPGNLFHSLAYLSWPLVGLGLAGLGRFGRPPERLLTIVALCLIIPVALSPANSPRNLSSGLVLLLLLGGTRWPSFSWGWGRRWVAALLLILMAGTAVYGVGTAGGLVWGSRWPQSSAVQAIRHDSAGWPAFATDLAGYPEPLFALDYGLASQIWYYAGRPAYTAWGQYRLWGIPDLTQVTVLSLEFLPEDLLTAKLRQAYRSVEGPQRFRFDSQAVTKEVRVWQAKGLVLDQDAFIQRFDFLTLWQEGG
jgi:4-amino-4-deoxy-L-arabinose transferase-like glycosyltransferase